MQTSRTLLCTLLTIVFFTSCEKVIDVDLNESAPRLVITASITDEPGPYYVQLTRSVNFGEPNDFPPATGAVVTITDDAGNSEMLEEISPGLFLTRTTEGKHGRTYTLTVLLDGVAYTSVSTMPLPVAINDLTIEEGGFIGESEREAVAWFQDTPGIRNYYRFRGWNGGLSFNKAFTFEDKAYDGAGVRYSLEPDEDNEALKIEPGDHIEVELQCVDRGVHLYFLTLSQYTGEGPPTAPANPVSNISNGALGYFSAHTVSRISVIAP